MPTDGLPPLESRLVPVSPDSSHSPLVPGATPPPAPLPSSAQRERIVKELTLHFAQDHLSMDDLERRLERVYRVQTVSDLDSIVAGLPALAAAPEEMSRGTERPAVATTADVPPRGIVWSIFGGAVRRGRWPVPRHLKVFVCFAGAELDLRQAQFGPGVTDIDVVAIMGGVEITVPPGVRVESSGLPILAGFEADSGDLEPPSADQPTVRVSGVAIMAGVSTKVRPLKKGKGDRRRAALNPGEE